MMRYCVPEELTIVIMMCDDDDDNDNDNDDDDDDDDDEDGPPHQQVSCIPAKSSSCRLAEAALHSRRDSSKHEGLEPSES